MSFQIAVAIKSIPTITHFMSLTNVICMILNWKLEFSNIKNDNFQFPILANFVWGTLFTARILLIKGLTFLQATVSKQIKI